MPRARQLTVFVLFTDGFFAATVYNSPPIESDWRWGEHRLKRTPSAVYHVFQRGGRVTPEILRDIIEAVENGRTSTVGLQS